MDQPAPTPERLEEICARIDTLTAETNALIAEVRAINEAAAQVPSAKMARPALRLVMSSYPEDQL